MSATTMHFGPEWMRTKHQPLSRSQPPPSPPPTNLINNSAVSSYSALVSATPPTSSEASDDVHPFRYSKEELLRIYQEGCKGGLGLEVERWDGVVREAGAEPIALREMSDAEKKLFTGPLNSELRRRPSQSTDFMSPLNTSALERPRLAHSSSSTANSPLRERFGALKRRDSGVNGSADAILSTLPRKPSLSALQAPTLSPRDMSPRTRVGYTTNFDGVLNNGESWIARRRISEASVKPISAAPGHDGIENQLNKAAGIREEKEDEQTLGSRSHQTDSQNFFASSSPHLRADEPRTYDSAGAPENPNHGTKSGSFGANGAANTGLFANNLAAVGPPPGLVDLAAVEWSYKDPTGQVQGPFRADLMQKWFNDGYFSDDLPMKRVIYDNHWTTVAELIQRANGENIFLSPLVSPIPPNRGNGSPMQSYPVDNAFTEPYQPAPVRSIRTSAIESYLGGGSLPSDSPSSSVGASHFGNASPDPAAFGGRDVKTYFGNEHLVSRLPTYATQDHVPSFPERRPLGQEYPNNGVNLQQGPSFGNFVSDRDAGFGGFGYSPAQVPHDPWMMGTNNIPPSMYAGGREHSGRVEIMHHDPITAFNSGGLYPTDTIGAFNTHVSGPNEVLHGYGQYDPTFQNAQDQQGPVATPIRDQVDISGQAATLAGLRNLNIEATPTKSPQNLNAAFPPAPVQSPWKTLPNVSASSSPHVSAATAWITEPIPATAPAHDDSPTGAPLLKSEDGTDSVPVPKAELPVPAESHAAVKSHKKATPLGATKKAHSRDPSDSVAAPDTLSQSSQTVSKVPSKVSTTSAPPQASPVDTPAVPAAPKTAWVKEEEGKKKVPAQSISLREIQEAEAKKLESRKAAEREKDKLARVSTVAESKEDIQSFTTSWGLPTSQTGSRGNVAVREATTHVAQAPTSAPVWTTPVKQPATKKSMKEIQEEEESRKKLATKEVVVPVAAKRGYAESTTKAVVPPPIAMANNVWTTVGPSGKTSTPVAPSPIRSVAQTATVVSTSGTPALSRASSSPVPRNMVNSALKTRPVVKAEDVSDVPSHEFLKWLSDSLKGLNSSVNVEEIMSMLLSFPLEPDATTIEIISDTIYSNSTTLDGRRFASEFVSKRKADARSKSSSTSNKAKPVSIADVVKAAPKTTQQEWGFKVVNKKKKGGR